MKKIFFIFFVFVFGSSCASLKEAVKQEESRPSPAKSAATPILKETRELPEQITRNVLVDSKKSEAVVSESHAVIPGKVEVVYDKELTPPPDGFKRLRLGASGKRTVEWLQQEAKRTGRVVFSVASLQKMWGTTTPLLEKPVVVKTTYRSPKSRKIETATGWIDDQEILYLCDIVSLDKEKGIIVLKPVQIGLCGNGAEGFRFIITKPRLVKKINSTITVVERYKNSTVKTVEKIYEAPAPPAPAPQSSITFAPGERPPIMWGGSGDGGGSGGGGGGCGGGAGASR